MMKGIAASKGIGIGRAVVLADSLDLNRLKGIKILEEDAEFETARLKKAFDDTDAKFAADKEKAARWLNEKDSQVFEAYRMILADPVFSDMVAAKIKSNLLSAEAAVLDSIDDIKALFLSVDDDYIKQRADDVENVGKSLIDCLLGKEAVDLSGMEEDSIIIAKDLTPADTVSMDKKYIRGFVTAKGGETSHTAIIARTLEIPAVVGCGENIMKTSQGETVIVDGEEGALIRQPDPETLNEYRIKRNRYHKELETAARLKDEPAVTPDGRTIELSGNIAKPPEAEAVMEKGGDGIGLFRTEFLYLDHSRLPEEEEQFLAYKEVAEIMGNRHCIIRTMDIGGDKKLPGIGIPNEDNPFLGYRAIRICLKETELFKIQIRAILRASAYGNLKIMFPMISGLEELREAKRIVEEVKAELDQKKIEFDKKIEIGIMIEIPSAAVISDLLAKEADFFSIGTNDLCQYTLAADRMNEHISYLYDPLNIGVLRLIKKVIDSGKENKIKVGMCGEMASNAENAVILLGLGLDEFSMVPASIPQIKRIIRNTTFDKAKRIAETALLMESSKDISNYVRSELHAE